MADSRQSIFDAAKSAGYANPKAENRYKPGSWQHKAWADGVQAGIDAAQAVATVLKTMDEVKRFDAAYFKSATQLLFNERFAFKSFGDTIVKIENFTTASGKAVTAMEQARKRISAPPPVIEHIRCLRADADNCDRSGKLQRAVRLRQKAWKLAERYSAF